MPSVMVCWAAPGLLLLEVEDGHVTPHNLNPVALCIGPFCLGHATGVEAIPAAVEHHATYLILCASIQCRITCTQ